MKKIKDSEAIECKYCGEMLKKDADRCPVCGGTVLENVLISNYTPPLANKPVRKHKRLIIFVLLAIVTCIIVAIIMVLIIGLI